jgi:hypothetical protein
MVALTSDEACALHSRLAEAGSAHSAGETLPVSANASTSVTFTGIEKAAVFDVLDRCCNLKASASTVGSYT